MLLPSKTRVGAPAGAVVCAAGTRTVTDGRSPWRSAAWASTRAASRSSARVCEAITASRRREVPAGTVGGRIAWAKTPCSSAFALASSAASGSPKTSGTIGMSLTSTPSTPRSVRAFSCRRGTSSGISSRALIAAPTEGGGSAVE